jgi:uncharacterized protein YqhQ
LGAFPLNLNHSEALKRFNILNHFSCGQQRLLRHVGMVVVVVVFSLVSACQLVEKFCSTLIIKE